MGDFELHLSTLFPDTRLKQHFEVRGADMSSPEYVKALSAFHVGLMYDELALNTALEYFAPISAEALWTARAQLDKDGLKTVLAGQSFQEHAEFLLDVASAGLSRWEPESVELLKPLITRVEQGLSPADLNRPLWSQGYESLMKGTQLA